MADSSALAGLLDRAERVFTLAGELGQAFRAQKREEEPGGWERNAPAFDELCKALAELRDAMTNPPDGFAAIANVLVEAGRTVKAVRDTVEQNAGRSFPYYLDFFPGLNQAAHDGPRAVWEARNKLRPQDPLGFLNEVGPAQPADPALTRLAEFPATPAGHLGFIERVLAEIHFAAEAKRNQFAESYSYETLQCTIGGRPEMCAEARRRLATLTELPAEARAEVDRVLTRELTIETVGRIDELLGPAVRRLRDAWEDFRANGEAAALLDAGLQDELAAQNEQKRQFWIQQCGMPANLTYEQGKAWAEAEQLRRDALDKAWHDKKAELERLVEVRCRSRMMAAGFREEEFHGGGYVPCLPRFVPGDDPRMPAYREAMEHLRKEQKALERALKAAARQIYGTGEDPPDPLAAQDGTEGQPVDRSEKESQPARSGESAAPEAAKPAKKKRSTTKGEGPAKLISALTKHHKYSDGGCLNLEPIGNNELARLAVVSESTASDFFAKKFQGYEKYRTVCRDAGKLADSLKVLNGEFSPHELYGRRPADEDDRDEADE